MLDEFRKHIAASGRDDILLHQTGCTGRCSREPIVGVIVPGQMPVKYERVDRNMVHEIFTSHVLRRQAGAGSTCSMARSSRSPSYEILICGSDALRLEGRRKLSTTALAEKLARRGAFARRRCRVTAGELLRRVQHAPTTGNCSHMLVRPDKVLYRVENEADLDEIIREHLLGGRPVERL